MALAHLQPLTVVRATGGLRVTLREPVSLIVAELVTTWGLQNNTTDAIRAGILMRFILVPGNGQTRADPTVLAPRYRAPTAAAANRDVDGDLILAEVEPDGGQIGFYKNIHTAYQKAPTWILDLVAAEQVKGMKPDNISNYFRMFNDLKVNGRPILEIVQVMAANIPDIMNYVPAAPNVAFNLSTTPWFRYHTTICSTPGLITRAINLLGNTIPGFYSDATIALVQAATARPWDLAAANAIDRRAVAATHAVLTAAKMLPENWYQGEKAKDDVTAGHYTAWVAIAKRALNLDGVKDLIMGAPDLTAALAAMPVGTVGV